MAAATAAVVTLLLWLRLGLGRRRLHLRAGRRLRLRLRLRLGLGWWCPEGRRFPMLPLYPFTLFASALLGAIVALAELGARLRRRLCRLRESMLGRRLRPLLLLLGHSLHLLLRHLLHLLLGLDGLAVPALATARPPS